MFREIFQHLQNNLLRDTDIIYRYTDTQQIQKYTDIQPTNIHRYTINRDSQAKISVQTYDPRYCHTRAPSWIISCAENLASSSLQDGATKWVYYAVGTTHPPTQPTVLVGTQKLKLFLSMLCGVPTPIVPPINKVCAVSLPTDT